MQRQDPEKETLTGLTPHTAGVLKLTWQKNFSNFLPHASPKKTFSAKYSTEIQSK